MFGIAPFSGLPFAGNLTLPGSTSFIVADRVQETTTTTGTGTLTLNGPVTGYQSFASAFGNGCKTYYAIVHQSLNEWEVRDGNFTYSDSTLTRGTCYASSNSNAAVSFSAGTKNVFCIQAASGPSSTTGLTVGDADGYVYQGTTPLLLPSYFTFSNGSTITYSNASGTVAIFTGTTSVTLKASTYYMFDAFYMLTKSAGSTSHNFSLLYGGTATLFSFLSYGYGISSGTTSGFTYDTTPNSFITNSTAAMAVRIGLTTQATLGIRVVGMARVNAGGTFIPQLNLSVAPGGSWVLQPNSYFRIAPVGSAASGANINIGGWAV